MSLETDLTAAEQPSQSTALTVSPSNDDDGVEFDASGQPHLNRMCFSPEQKGSGPLTPHDFINTPLALLPIYVPSLRQGVQGFDGGINKAALEVHRDKGLLINLLPYLGWAAGDFCELFWGDTISPVAIYSVRQDDIDNDRLIAMYVPLARIIDGAVSPVFIKVTPLTGNAQETQRFNFKVDTAIPASRNPVASTLQNENLPAPVFAQNIIDFGVTEEDAQRGVTVDIGFYPVDTGQPNNTFRAARDRIRLSVGGVQANFPPITEGQASGRQPIRYTLYYGFWQEVGSGSHICEYEVVDECGNASDGWCPAVVLNVELDDAAEPRLPEAYFDEAPEDILDHDELEGKDATIVVPINRLGYNLGDIIRATVIGRTADGLTKIVTTYDSPPLTSTTIRQITLPCPNADLRKLIGGRLQLSYARIRSGSPDRLSNSILVHVIGTPIETGLRPPIIVDAPGGELNPDLLTVTVDVPIYDGRDPFDLITLALDGQDASGKFYYREFDRTAGTGMIRFQLRNGPDGDIKKLEGGSLRFFYWVTNADGKRMSLDVTVQVGGPVATLPAPQVVEAPPPQYQFDPAAELGDATVIVPANNSFLVGDTVILYCNGTVTGGTQPPVTFPILSHWVGRDLPFTLQRAYILANLGQSMTIFYEHRRPGAATRTSLAVNMKVGSRRVLSVPRVLEATVYNEHISILNPQHVLPPNREEVTIRVIVDGFPAAANIKLFIIGKPGIGTPDIPEKPARPEPGTNYVSFTVPNDFVAAYLGGECTVFYYLIELSQSTKSDELTLEVEALSPQSLELVSIPEQSGGVINADAANSVRILAWPFFKTGQQVNIFLDCVVDLDLRRGTPVTPAEFNARRTLDPIPQSYLAQLNDGGSLTVKVSVSMDGTGNPATAVQLPWITYGVRKGVGTIVQRITIGTGPNFITITPDGKKAYVARSGSGTISSIDINTREILRTLSFGGVTDVVASPTKNVIYTSNGTYPYGINTLNDSFFHLTGTTLYARGLSVSPFGTRLAFNRASGASYNNTYIFDTDDFTKGFGPYIDGNTQASVWSPDANYLYTVFGRLSRFEVQTRIRTHDIPLTGAYGVAHTPLDAQKSRLYVADTNGNRVMIYNTTNGCTFVKSLDNIRIPYKIVISPTQNRAYVTAFGENTIQIIDTDSEELIGTIRLLNQPYGLAITPNGKELWVTENGGSTVAIINVG